ncbi:hypothetical protein BJ166DRAFT_5550 [Pestalotiopsis sp. NC0098]|nr:hypothetical protein BJ166DRAFT_5550 [Pestalotiopsis sp. NC0098]
MSFASLEICSASLVYRGEKVASSTHPRRPMYQRDFLGGQGEADGVLLGLVQPRVEPVNISHLGIRGEVGGDRRGRRQAKEHPGEDGVVGLGHLEEPLHGLVHAAVRDVVGELDEPDAAAELDVLALLVGRDAQRLPLDLCHDAAHALLLEVLDLPLLGAARRLLRHQDDVPGAHAVLRQLAAGIGRRVRLQLQHALAAHSRALRRDDQVGDGQAGPLQRCRAQARDQPARLLHLALQLGIEECELCRRKRAHVHGFLWCHCKNVL